MNPRSLALYQLRHEPVLKNHAIMLDNIIICRLYRTIWRPKKATKSATFEIPNWFHKSLKNQRHICSTFIRKFVNDVWSSKQWTSDSLEQRLFLRPFWPYSLHTFSLVSLVKKYATCKAKMAFQKAFISRESDVHCFSDPIINTFYNECGKDTVFELTRNISVYQGCLSFYQFRWSDLSMNWHELSK